MRVRRIQLSLMSSVPSGRRPATCTGDSGRRPLPVRVTVSSTKLASATSRLAGPARHTIGSPTSLTAMPGWPRAVVSTSTRAPAATGIGHGMLRSRAGRAAALVSL
jgi:hypothetical protein